MTTVTNISAATPGNGMAGPAQGAGSAVAGFEALLAAFFGEPATLTPLQGVGGALAPAPAAPMLMNGEMAAPATGETAMSAEAMLAAGLMTPVGAEGEGKGEASQDQDAEAQADAVVDPTLLADVGAIVAPQVAPVVTVAPAAQDTTAEIPASAKTAATPQAIAPQASPADTAAVPAVTTEAQPAQTASKSQAEAPAHGLAKGKANASPNARAATPVHANAPAPPPADTKAVADVPVAEGDAEAATEFAAAKAEVAPQADTSKAAAPTPRAPQQAQAAAPTATPAAAPTLDADPVETAAAVAAAASEAATGETETTETTTAPTQDTSAAMAGRMAAAAQRPRDAKGQAEPQTGKADSKDAAPVTGAARKAAAATAATTATPAPEGPTRKERDIQTEAAAPAPAQAEGTHAPVHEERSAEAARGPNAAPQAAQHPVRGSPETVANLAAQIVKKLNGKATRFDLELTPHGMGTVDVRIEIQNGRVTAAMMFDSPQAAAELKARANELQRSLEQAGFDLSGGLSFEAKDGGEAGRGWRQAQDQNDGRGMRGQAFQNALGTAAEAADVAESGALRLRRGLNSSALDVRV